MSENSVPNSNYSHIYKKYSHISIMNPVNRNILRLAIPSIVSNITVPLLGLVDLTIVGHMGDARYISAVAIGTMIFNSIYWLTLFLRMGTSGMTAQAFGAQDRTEVLRILQRTLFVGLFLGVLLLMLSPLLRPLLIYLMSTPPDAVVLVETYFDIVIFGAPAMLALYGLTGWFVGMQDTRTPMWVAIFQNVVNIVVSLLLVVVCGWKMEGVATGTLVAQWSGALVALAALARRLHQPFLHTSLVGLLADYLPHRKEVFSRPALHRFFVVNRDIFLRTLCMVAVNASFTSFGGRQGALVLSANTLLLMFFTFFSYIMDGFAFAGEALCGKHYGAGEIAQLRFTTRRLMIFGAVMVVAFTTVYVLFGKEILLLMTSDTSVVEASTHYLFWAYLIPVAGMAAFIYDGVFIGTTKTRAMLATTFVAALVFFGVNIGLILLAETEVWPASLDHNHILWLAYILFLTARGVVQSFLYLRLFCLSVS